MNWILWSLLSALFAGLTAIFAKVGVEKIDSNVATAIRTTVVLLISWGIAAFTTKTNPLTAIDRTTWTFLLLSGIATGLSWLCYFRALQLSEVSKVAPIDKLSVVIAVVLSIFIFGEKVNLREGFGIGLIVTGALLLVWK